MKIVFRVDSSFKIGTGHVMRCLTLAMALKKSGAEVSFICRKFEGALIEYLLTHSFYVICLEHNIDSHTSNQNKAGYADWLGVDQEEDAAQCIPYIKKIKPDWVIVDHYAIDESWEMNLKPYVKNIMVIDDLANRNHCCDILLDQNLGVSPDKYQSLVTCETRILAGSLYALLRPEFSEWRNKSIQRRMSPKLNKILVNLGGIDSENITLKVLREMQNTSLANEAVIQVVMGGRAPHIEEVENFVNSCEMNVELLVGVSNMAELMTFADLAIGAAGSTSWERACLGLPTIQVVIAENQKELAAALLIHRAALLLEDVSELPSVLDSAKRKLAEMSENALNICDGHGVGRVVNAIYEKSL